MRVTKLQKEKTNGVKIAQNEYENKIMGTDPLQSLIWLT